MLVQTEATQRRLPGGHDYHREGDHEDGDEDEDEGIVGGDIPSSIVLLIINKPEGVVDYADDTVNVVLGDDAFDNDE